MTFRPPRALPRRRSRGLTLIEATIVTGVVAVLVGVSLPSLQGLAERRALEGAAAQLETDLYLARSEAVARNATVRISFSQTAQGSCYVMYEAAAGSCRCEVGAATTCDGATQAMRIEHFAAAGRVRLQSNVSHMSFDPTQGTVTPTGTLRLNAEAGAVHAVVNIMGRVRACSPQAQVPGYRRC